MMEGPWCRFRREARPASDIDTVVVDSLKALDPEWPIREADIAGLRIHAMSGSKRFSFDDLAGGRLQREGNGEAE
jgi:hypothetical protein